MRKLFQLLLIFYITILISIIWGTINYSYLCRLVKTNNSHLDNRLLLDEMFPTQGPMYQCNQFEIVITPVLLVVLSILFLYLLHVYWDTKAKNRIKSLKNYLHIVSANIIFGFVIILLMSLIPHLSIHFMDSYAQGLQKIDISTYFSNYKNGLRIILTSIIQIFILHFGVYAVSLFKPFINIYIKRQAIIYLLILALSIPIVIILMGGIRPNYLFY